MPTPQTLSDDVDDVCDIPGPWGRVIHDANRKVNSAEARAFSFDFRSAPAFGLVYAHTAKSE